MGTFSRVNKSVTLKASRVFVRFSAVSALVGSEISEKKLMTEKKLFFKPINNYIIL